MKKHYVLFTLLFYVFLPCRAQTVGLMQHDAGSLDNGYVLFAPLASTTTYLIDKCGHEVKTWHSSYTPGASVYLLPDGTLLRTGNTNNPNFVAGGQGGIVEKIDWDDNIVWSYQVSDATHCQHHDVRALPNGNVLILAWEAVTQQMLLDAGRNPENAPENYWSMELLEIQPVGANGGNVVWEWHLWDHLVQEFDQTKANYNGVADNPQLMDVNYYTGPDADWIHTNSVDYNPALDQILLSSFTLGELWIIDHSTTTEEAAGHTGGNSGKGGDFLYRIGNPAVSGHDTAGNILFNGQHNAQWISDGLPFASQILVHNNGNGRIGGNYSTVEIIEPPVNGYNYDLNFPTLPTADSWIYNAGNPNGYYAPFISGAQQLPNGNVLVCDGPGGKFFEVTSAGEMVWNYVCPVNQDGPIPQGTLPTNAIAFRCAFYPFDYSGFDGHTLVAGNPIEGVNALTENCSLNLANLENFASRDVIAFPNPANDILNVRLPESEPTVRLTLINSLGQTVYHASLENKESAAIATNRFASGLYYLRVETPGRSATKKIVIQ